VSDKANIAAAVLAHVDAGKTTLSEALLYESGMIRRAGRVDNKDAFLDTFALEKERGITIFSKQAVLKLLDTPGHVDFSAEMERTLQVLDYAILVISGADGVQAHTRTLFGLLAKYEVPVFLFVNKMDQPGTDQEALLLELKKELHENCVDFSDQESAAFAENVAVCDEQVLEQYLAGEAVGTDQKTDPGTEAVSVLFRICAQDAGGEGVSGGLYPVCQYPCLRGDIRCTGI